MFHTCETREGRGHGAEGCVCVPHLQLGDEVGELGEVDHPVAVGVELGDVHVELRGGQLEAEAVDDGAQLGGRDEAVAVDVDILEDLARRRAR